MNTKIIGSTILAAMLAACSSSKDANNGNFEKAVNAHFAKDCITIQPFVVGGGHKYPMTIALQQKGAFTSQAQVDQSNANTTRPVEILVKAGVLAVSEGTKKIKPIFSSNNEIIVPTKVYTLTEMGKKAIVDAESTAMCAGRYKVDEVIRFTQPNNAMGQTISQVSLTASPVDVPEWAKGAEIQKLYGLDKKLAPQRMTRAVVLASDGWIDANDFGR